MKQLRELYEYEVLALCRRKLCKGKKRFTLYLSPKTIPPFKPFKVASLEDEVVGVRYFIYSRPNPQDGGWLLSVRVEELETFNPVLKENPFLSSK